MRQQFRSSAVPQFRSSAVPQFRFVLSLLFCLVGSTAAKADQPQPLMGGEIIPQDFAQIVFGEPGELLIDGSDHKTILPLPMQGRTFSSYEEYVKFLQSAFNLRVEDESTGFEHQVVKAGSFFSYDADLKELIQVSDPLLTLIGGRMGVVTIDGEEYCVDGDRCADPVHYLFLGHPEEEMSDGDTEQGVASSSTNANSANGTASVTALSDDFSIRGKLEYWTWTGVGTIPDYGPKRGSTTRAITWQEKGGFKILRKLQVNGGAQCWSYLVGAEGCYWVPAHFLIVETTGANRLSARAQGWAKQERDKKACQFYEAFDVKHESRNTSSVSVDWTFSSTEFELSWNAKDRARVWPTYVEGEHYGRNSLYSWPAKVAWVFTHLETNPPEC